MYKTYIKFEFIIKQLQPERGSSKSVISSQWFKFPPISKCSTLLLSEPEKQIIY